MRLNQWTRRKINLEEKTDKQQQQCRIRSDPRMKVERGGGVVWGSNSSILKSFFDVTLFCLYIWKLIIFNCGFSLKVNCGFMQLKQRRIQHVLQFLPHWYLGKSLTCNMVNRGNRGCHFSFNCLRWVSNMFWRDSLVLSQKQGS